MSNLKKSLKNRLKSIEVNETEETYENAVLVRPEQVKNLMPSEKKRTARVQGMLRPVEREKFLNSLGRESESNAIRRLVLEHLERCKVKND